MLEIVDVMMDGRMYCVQSEGDLRVAGTTAFADADRSEDAKYR